MSSGIGTRNAAVLSETGRHGASWLRVELPLNEGGQACLAQRYQWKPWGWKRHSELTADESPIKEIRIEAVTYRNREAQASTQISQNEWGKEQVIESKIYLWSSHVHGNKPGCSGIVAANASVRDSRLEARTWALRPPFLRFLGDFEQFLVAVVNLQRGLRARISTNSGQPTYGYGSPGICPPGLTLCNGPVIRYVVSVAVRGNSGPETGTGLNCTLSLKGRIVQRLCRVRFRHVPFYLSVTHWNHTPFGNFAPPKIPQKNAQVMAVPYDKFQDPMTIPRHPPTAKNAGRPWRETQMRSGA
ncbi:hypothetical protein DFH09DRAFT_1104658 [Mycena vulgaris]|nr:hypothetical protein DFH09DRAFT_1104658 [Mycena vulgaris]